jgi:hypothetical protein
VARKYANIVTAVWRNADFCALDAEEQRTYFLLISQPDISAAGVLHLSPTRWSTKARNTTPESILVSLTKLASARFVFYDVRTEELLVRSFVRWDGGFNNSKRRPAIRDAAKQVESPMIRHALAVELARLGLPEWLPDALSDSPSDTTPVDEEDSHTTPPDEETQEMDDGLFSLGNRVSDRPSDGTSRFERVVVTKGLYIQPQPTTLEPGTAPSVSVDTDSLTVNQRSRLITNAYAEAEPLCKWPAVNGIVIKAVQSGQFTDDAIREALLRLAKEGRSVTVDTLRTELRGFPPRRQGDRLTEVNGMHLKPSNVANLERQQRMQALDAEQERARAIEGTQR